MCSKAFGITPLNSGSDLTPATYRSMGNGPYPQLHHNIKMVAIVGGLCTEWYWERWRLAMIMFIYCSKGEGEVYIFTYKTNVCSFASISKLRSGFVWLDYFVPHHVN